MPAPTTIVELDDVKESIGIDAAETSEDDRITALLTQVTSLCESYCRRKLLVTDNDVTELYNGSGGRTLLLRRFPVDSVTTIHANEDIPRSYAAASLLVSGTDFMVDADAGLVYREGGTWPCGIQSVQVVYKGGYGGTHAIPDDLKRAVIEIIQVKLNKGKDQLYHLTSENRGDDMNQVGIRFNDITENAREVLDNYRDWRVAA